MKSTPFGSHPENGIIGMWEPERFGRPRFQVLEMFPIYQRHLERRGVLMILSEKRCSQDSLRIRVPKTIAQKGPKLALPTDSPQYRPVLRADRFSAYFLGLSNPKLSIRSRRIQADARDSRGAWLRASIKWPGRSPKSPNRRQWSICGIPHSEKVTYQMG